jgi:hypothetical protein
MPMLWPLTGYMWSGPVRGYAGNRYEQASSGKGERSRTRLCPYPEVAGRMRSPVLSNDVPTSSSTTVAGSTRMYSTGSLGRCPNHEDGIIAGQEWRSVGGVSTLASSGAGWLRKWRGPADHPQSPRPEGRPAERAGRSASDRGTGGWSALRCRAEHRARRR